MSSTSEELFEIANRLGEVTRASTAATVREPLDALETAADQVGKAWSGSFIGYHSRVYYHGLQPPPPGAHFSPEWGFAQVFGHDTRGQWEEQDFDSVQSAIREAAGRPDWGPAQALAKEAREVFEDSRAELVSVLSVMLEERDDTVVSELRSEAAGLALYGASDFVEALRPKQWWSRDSNAMSQGIQVPPHLDVLADVFAARSPIEQCRELARLAGRAASHAARRERRSRGTGEVPKLAGNRVFIGHGNSSAWRDLKDLVQDRLGLPYDEFNRVSVAGLANTERLSEMLDNAAVAFLVMTAEDEQADGQWHARMNVIHEAGLFQGRLGFRKAIVLLEEGCEEFSNIQGLGQIRFPKGNLGARFEKIREVLEREGLIGF